MYLCDDGHDEICYEGKYCPCCEMIKQISDFDNVIYNLKEEISNLKDKEE